MLLLLLFPQPAPASPGFVNFGVTVGELWPSLNARSAADAVWWTEAELYDWIDEAAKRLARKLGVFVRRDTSLSTVATQGAYTLPARHIATLQADVAGFVLKARNVHEIEALDASWPTASDAPKAYLQDTQGLVKLTLYPKPNVANAGRAIGLVIEEYPATISASAGTLAAPPVIEDYFAFYALAEARAKESNASMDEVADWFRQLVTMYEGAIAGLWGQN